MLKNLILYILILAPFLSYAQINLTGRVVDAESNEPIIYANIIVEDVEKSKILTYDISNDNGEFSLEYKGNLDSLRITVTAVNIESKSIVVAAQSQNLDIRVNHKILKIKAVLIKGREFSVIRTSDTLTYNVGKYLDANDKSIEDVIKKLPGIKVKKDGTIYYNNEPISHFYIEDMDMLGGRYPLASKNIDPKKIKSVNVYENHQSKKVLKDIVRPKSAALNLRLKDSVKGVWTGSIEAGMGYKPLMWNAEATAMFFGKKFQTINTYKTNNMGDDVSKQFDSKFGGLAQSYSMIGMVEPTKPNISENLYLNNNIHAISSNFIVKLAKDNTLRANINYSHDNQNSEGMSKTTHYIDKNSPIIINEAINTIKESDKLNVDLNFMSNKDRAYTSNTFLFKGENHKEEGNVINDEGKISQNFSMPLIAVGNKLNMIVRLKEKFTLDINSDIEYNTQASTLHVSPTIIPLASDSIFNNGSQYLGSHKLIANNRIHTSFMYKDWHFGLGAGFNAHVENMNSNLSPMNNMGELISANDSMLNNILWQKYEIYLGPSIRYNLSDYLNIAAYVNTEFMFLNVDDKIGSADKKVNKVLFSPHFAVNGNITYDLKYSLDASYNEFFGSLYDAYSGFIMSDYRSISLKNGNISHTKMQNYSASLNYANAIAVLFTGIKASYWRSHNNLTYGVDYKGLLSYVHSYNIPNLSHGLDLDWNFSKQVDILRTTFKTSLSWMRSWSEIIRQDSMLNSRNDMIVAEFGFVTRFSSKISFDYDIAYSRSMGNIENIGNTEPIDFIEQDAELLFSFKMGIVASISCSHFFNTAIESQDRNMVFMNAKITYAYKKFDFSLEGRNLLNTDNYSSAYTTDITNYIYSYKLRPVSLIASVRFRF